MVAPSSVKKASFCSCPPAFIPIGFPAISRFIMYLMLSMVLFSIAWFTRYLEPNKPCSSPMNMINLMVRLGFRLFALKARAISIIAKDPIPLSMAPVAKSQESKCPPRTITSSGNSLPGRVATTFLALIISLVLVISIWADTAFSLSFSFKDIPSSIPIQTAGIGISPPVTEAVPVNNTPLGT